jgi:uncharacterized protein (TIGR02246 family)
MKKTDTRKDAIEVVALYEQLIQAWNEHVASGMAECFLENGEMIGFDGSYIGGRDEIYSHLHQIFSNHTPPPFIKEVKSVRLLSNEVAILRAIVGMVPPGKTEIEPSLNAHQTMTAASCNGKWQIALFQNTPAQFHGRPELVQQMTNELKNLL